MLSNKKIKLLKSIIDDSKGLLSINDYKNAKSLVDNNECLLSLELVCEQLFEYNCHITKQLFGNIEKAGDYYELDKEILSLARQLVVD